MTYRGGIDMTGSGRPDRKNLYGQWLAMPVAQCIYPYVHYHSMIHEDRGDARPRQGAVRRRQARRST
jgi:uncharacterized protein YjlB